MTDRDDKVVIVGQGLAGTCLAWRLWDRGMKFRIVDRGGERGSSAVAAGLLSPVTGKAMNPGWRVGEFLDEAMEFFKKVQMVLGEQFFHPMPILRLFGEESEREKFESKRGVLEPWIDGIVDELPRGMHGEWGGVVWKRGGWFKTKRFLTASMGYFREHGLYEQREVGEEEVLNSEDSMVLCQGSAGLGGGVFGYLPERRAKGDILTVRVPGLAEDRILSRGGWMIPRGGALFRAGSGYEWEHLSSQPTPEGRERVEEIIRSLTPLHYEVLDHVAGVRPIIRQSQPVVGWHKDLAKVAIFNGLGSKGVLYAPGVSLQLARHFCDGAEIEPELDVREIGSESGE